MKEVLDLENAGWEALSTGEDAAVEFYDTLLLDDAVMVFPGGMRIAGKAEILRSFGSQPWMAYSIEDPAVARPADDVALLTYEVSAQRQGSEPYEAVISSLYVMVDGVWRLGFHQHSQA